MALRFSTKHATVELQRVIDKHPDPFMVRAVLNATCAPPQSIESLAGSLDVEESRIDEVFTLLSKEEAITAIGRAKPRNSQFYSVSNFGVIFVESNEPPQYHWHSLLKSDATELLNAAAPFVSFTYDKVVQIPTEKLIALRSKMHRAVELAVQRERHTLGQLAGVPEHATIGSLFVSARDPISEEQQNTFPLTIQDLLYATPADAFIDNINQASGSLIGNWKGLPKRTIVSATVRPTNLCDVYLNPVLPARGDMWTQSTLDELRRVDIRESLLQKAMLPYHQELRR